MYEMSYLLGWFCFHSRGEVGDVSVFPVNIRRRFVLGQMTGIGAGFGAGGIVVSVIFSPRRSISSGAHTINSIVVLDTPGLQNPASCGRQGGATFDEFCFNYVQERLQLLFHEQTVISERENYAQVRARGEMPRMEGTNGELSQLTEKMFSVCVCLSVCFVWSIVCFHCPRGGPVDV